MKHFITVVGLDVHKDSIDIVIAETAAKQEVRHFGKVGGDPASFDKAVRKLVSTGAELLFVYEAGPCGYDIYRHLSKQGHVCAVVAPSMIHRRSGDCIKTDRRDAIQEAYNTEHNITPESIKKSIGDILGSVYEADYFTVPAGPVGKKEEAIPIEELPGVIKSLQKEMKEAAARLQFERAAELRDRIKELKEMEMSLGVRV